MIQLGISQLSPRDASDGVTLLSRSTGVGTPPMTLVVPQPVCHGAHTASALLLTRELSSQEAACTVCRQVTEKLRPRRPQTRYNGFSAGS